MLNRKMVVVVVLCLAVLTHNREVLGVIPAILLLSREHALLIVMELILLVKDLYVVMRINEA